MLIRLQGGSKIYTLKSPVFRGFTWTMLVRFKDNADTSMGAPRLRLKGSRTTL